MIDLVILEGLKEALARGESLKQAMMSFYNAGYGREQIQKAARALQMQQRGQPLPVQPAQYRPQPVQSAQPIQPKLQPTQKKVIQPLPKPIQRVSSYGLTPYNNEDGIKKIKLGINSAIDQLNRIEFPNGKPPTQNISNYEPKPKRKKTVIILVISLVVLMGILGAIFLFKEQILDFFDNSSFFSGLF